MGMSDAHREGWAVQGRVSLTHALKSPPQPDLEASRSLEGRGVLPRAQPGVRLGGSAEELRGQ
jgi:hypothetical protein